MYILGTVYAFINILFGVLHLLSFSLKQLLLQPSVDHLRLNALATETTFCSDMKKKPQNCPAFLCTWPKTEFLSCLLLTLSGHGPRRGCVAAAAAACCRGNQLVGISIRQCSRSLWDRVQNLGKCLNTKEIYISRPLTFPLSPFVICLGANTKYVSMPFSSRYSHLSPPLPGSSSNSPCRLSLVVWEIWTLLNRP